MKKIAIIYPEAPDKTIRRAVDFLTEFILDFTLEYPLCFSAEDFCISCDYIPIYLGTKENNPAIRKLSTAHLTSPEQYHISVKDGTVIIEGYDVSGVLFGVMDFYNKYLIPTKYAHPDINNFSIFDGELPGFSLISAPEVSERGIWTWGHVIYDYKGFLDNMARLKLNSLIMWNDFIPFNIQEIIDYAHTLNIKVILGYSWGWDQRCKELSLDSLNGKGEEIFNKFEREYSRLDIDGIYFQTITELQEEYIGGKLVAEAVTDFVNNTSALFYSKYPDILIEFGLHATSVKNRLDIIGHVDKRIRIVWEDFGAMPFAYHPEELCDYDQTLSLAKAAATLRGTDDNYGVVTKSLTCLDWSEFTHPGAVQNIGVSSHLVKENRLIRKRKAWRNSVAGWLANGEYARKAIYELAKVKSGAFSVNALLEDGMLEEKIMYPIALFSELLWNPEADYSALVREVALREYVEFT